MFSPIDNLHVKTTPLARDNVMIPSQTLLKSILCCGLLMISLINSSGATAVKKPPAKWEEVARCSFLPDEYHDGDNFHVTCGGTEFVFRLYFVDTPEIDVGKKDKVQRARVQEQQKHFRVSPAELSEYGEAARKFTSDQLKNSFTVTTRRQNAGGRGRLPRFYAFVKVKDGDLGELLIQNGLARAHGEVAILPNGTPAKIHMAELRKLEREAKAGRKGLWAAKGNQ